MHLVLSLFTPLRFHMYRDRIPRPNCYCVSQGGLNKPRLVLGKNAFRVRRRKEACEIRWTTPTEVEHSCQYGRHLESLQKIVLFPLLQQIFAFYMRRFVPRNSLLSLMVFLRGSPKSSFSLP